MSDCGEKVHWPTDCIKTLLHGIRHRNNSASIKPQHEKWHNLLVTIFLLRFCICSASYPLVLLNPSTRGSHLSVLLHIAGSRVFKNRKDFHVDTHYSLFPLICLFMTIMPLSCFYCLHSSLVYPGKRNTLETLTCARLSLS